LKEALAEAPERKTLLTNCPACLQGLGRQERLGVKVTHLAVALAEASGGGTSDSSMRIEPTSHCTGLLT